MRNVEIICKCDQCEEVFPESEITVVPLTWGKKTVLNDLCAECKLNLQNEVFWALLKNGRKPDAETGKPVEIHPCSVAGCDKSFDTKQGLSMHTTLKHKSKPAPRKRVAKRTVKRK